MIEHLTAATFDEAVAADTPVVVDFWAAWCGPCKAMEPILDELADERSGTLKVAKVNADDEAGLARRFEVMSLPTLLVFADGELKGRIVGARGSAALNAELDRMLGA